MDHRMICDVRTCDESVSFENNEYCRLHLSRSKHFGTPTPLMKCYGCSIEFSWAAPRFRGAVHCDECIQFLIKYAIYIPRYASSINSHGITVVEFIKQLVVQDFSCCMCYSKFGKDGKRINIDHDHLCCKGQYGCKKCIRGLICPTCNAALAVIENIPDILGRIEIHQKSRPFFKERDSYGS